LKVPSRPLRRYALLPRPHSFRWRSAG